MSSGHFAVMFIFIRLQNTIKITTAFSKWTILIFLLTLKGWMAQNRTKTHKNGCCFIRNIDRISMNNMSRCLILQPIKKGLTVQRRKWTQTRSMYRNTNLLLWRVYWRRCCAVSSSWKWTGTYKDNGNA